MPNETGAQGIKMIDWIILTVLLAAVIIMAVAANDCDPDRMPPDDLAPAMETHYYREGGRLRTSLRVKK